MQAWCENCQKNVEVRIEDQGIGPYEFWGMKGVDRCDVAICDECEEALESISASEVAQEEAALRADYEYDRMRDKRNGL